MTKQLFHVFAIFVSCLSKTLIGLFLVSGFAFANKQSPSFSFSKDKGLQPLSSVTEQIEKPDSETKARLSDEKAEEKSDPALISPAESYSKENTELNTPQHSISEDFAPQAGESIEGTSFLNSSLEDWSWFFQEKKTKHKLALTPVYSYNRTQGSRLGLRFFAYSTDKKGYYFAFSGSRYLFHPFSRFNMSYIGHRRGNFRTESSFIYDNHYENYFGEGMKARLSDLKKLYAHRFMADYKMIHQAPNQNFYMGLGAQLFFRKERPQYQGGEIYFNKELFLFLKGFVGYDSRDNWKDPKTGAFHQLSFGCKAILAYPGGYCKGEGDLRFYLSLFKETHFAHSLKNSVVALRVFAGSSFLSPSTYSTAYSLGGENPFQNIKTLRGYKQNRFRGDKMYFSQTEIRFPIWKQYLDGAVFAELGETTNYEDPFEGSVVVDYGGGLRIGLPPDYDMKIRADFGTGRDKQKKRNYNFIVSFFQAF